MIIFDTAIIALLIGYVILKISGIIDSLIIVDIIKDLLVDFVKNVIKKLKQ